MNETYLIACPSLVLRFYKLLTANQEAATSDVPQLNTRTGQTIVLKEGVKMDNNIIRCEGWRRYSVFTFGGTTKWRQCEKDAIVSLEVVQDGKTETMPVCMICWKEGIEHKIQINKTIPI